MTFLMNFPRVKETATDEGTGNLELEGALSGKFVTFDDGGNTYFTYVVVNRDADEWEEGIGTLSGASLVRVVVTRSSNANAAVNFSAGTKDVFCAAIHDQVGALLPFWGTGIAGALTISGATVVTLTEDAYYTTVDWAASATGYIDTNGFRLYCALGLDLTNAPAGAIRNDAVAGQGAPGVSVAAGLNRCFQDTDSATIATFGITVPLLGGRGGTGGATPRSDTSWRDRVGPLSYCQSSAGMYAGGGAIENINSNGGGGGGCVEVYARQITRTSGGTAAGAIRANGGAGVTSMPGGGGGRIRIWHAGLSGSAKTAAIHANGGDGNSEDGGYGGACEIYNMLTGATSFSQGSANSGATAGTLSVDL